MTFDWLFLMIAAAVGAAVAEAVRFMGSRLYPRLTKIGKRVNADVSYHPLHHSLILAIRNRTVDDVELERVIVHPQTKERSSWFEPVEIDWAPIFELGQERTGSRGACILPGGMALFTAGHPFLERQFRQSDSMRVMIEFKDGAKIKRRIGFRSLRTEEWHVPPYQPKDGEKLVPSETMKMLVPSFPPRWKPAIEIVRGPESSDSDKVPPGESKEEAAAERRDPLRQGRASVDALLDRAERRARASKGQE